VTRRPVTEIEGGRDQQWLCNADSFDQQVSDASMVTAVCARAADRRAVSSIVISLHMKSLDLGMLSHYR
jgi:hypothetical protein